MEQTNEHQVTKKTNLSIIGIAGLAFCGVLVETSMNVTFPTLMRDFHQSLNAVQWVTTGYLLTVALTVVLAAFLQRRFKLRGLIVASSLAFITGGLLCALAPQLWMLLLGRLIQGISTGLAMPLLFFVIMQQNAADSICHAGNLRRLGWNGNRAGTFFRTNLWRPG
ncbi:MAG: MFS transporter [Limosilactobacillus mucosae]